MTDQTLRMTDNRKPIYSKDHEDKRVISIPNGLWTPQRRVSHTPGHDAYTDRTGLKPVFHPHFDPWQDIHMPCDRLHAMSTAFGPKAASQIV
jgi:hypothetical protein